MAELSEIVASENEFTGLDKKVYKLAPLGLKEIGELCVWIQYKEYEAAKLIGLDKDHLYEVYKECKSLPIKFEDQTFLSGILTASGLHKLIWYSMKLANPEVAEGFVSTVVATKNINEISDKVLRCSGLIGDEKDVKGESQTGQK